MASKKRFLLSVASFFILVAIYGIASAQSVKEAEGKAAEQAGRLREALTHYVAALQSVSEGSADDQRLRETIIKLVQKLSPPPAVPEDARKYMARGAAAVEIAKTPEDLKRAAAEFQQVLLAAPWLANGYNNLAVVQEKSGDFHAAMRNFKLYLLAAPQSPDAEQIQSRIYGLELKAERQKEEAQAAAAAERKRTQQASLARVLNGTWYSAGQGVRARYEVTVSGKSIVIAQTAYWHPIERIWIPMEGDPPRWGRSGAVTFQGEIDGIGIKGVRVIDLTVPWSNGAVVTHPMTGSVSADGSRIRLNYVNVYATGGRGRVATGWSEVSASEELERR